MSTTVATDTNEVWRCSSCHKVKDLKGPHLNGKTSVRSDCWPCAKKTTFELDASGAKKSVTETTSASTASQLVTTPPSIAATNEKSSVFMPPAVPLDVEEARYLLSVDETEPASSSTPAPAAPSSTSADHVWRCSSCHKVKDLKGPHLNGKTSVRSDCWPCAKKTTFVLDAVATAAATKSDSAAAGSAKALLNSPAKSAFGAAATSSDAKPPAASAFKSAFGAAATGSDAKPPAASAFKSAFGAAATGSDAKPPAASAFKSAFGAAATSSDAKPPAASAFKSAFGAAATGSDAKPPAASAFKSAFGAAATSSDAKPPAASAFKSAFGAAATSSDAKPPAASAFKSAFGAAATGSDAKPPAASAFKSAFGAAATSSDAKPPAASAFKSAFGAAATGSDAKPPAASAFKSAFGAAATSSDAKPPAASAFKSAFGAAATSSDAKPPAASAFKSAFGAAATSSDAKPPAASAFKSAFGAAATGSDAKPPAASAFKSAFGAAATGSDAKPPAASAFKSAFGAAATGSDAKPPAASAFAVVKTNSEGGSIKDGALKVSGASAVEGESGARTITSTQGVWRCSTCHKVKDLKGPHLNGKTSVRSDCWPCAKKTTFELDASGAKKSVTETTSASTASQLVTTPPSIAATNEKSSVFMPPAVPLDVEEARYLLSVDETEPASSSTPAPAAPSSTSADHVWRCSSCHKVKDLKGPHLNGKTSVRSDCWPCAKKTTFVLDAVATAAATKSDSAAAGSAKALLNSPAKSAFGAAATSSDAKPPAASAFKSAFGVAATSSDAKPPAASAFKSAFGAAATSSDAKPPAASAFKSAFGAAATSSDAKPPAASAFKSAFGAALPADKVKVSPFPVIEEGSYSTMTDDDADLELSLPAEEPAEVTTSYEDCSSSAASEKNVHSDSSSDAARPSDVVGAKGGFSPSFSFGANIAVKSDSVPTAVPSGGGGGLFGKGPNPFGAANAKEGDAKPFVFGAAFENNKNTAVATESAGIFGAVGGAARPFSSSSAKDGGGAAFSFGADSLKKGDRPAGAVPTRGAAGAVGSQPKHMDPANVKKDDDTPAKRSVEGNTTINEGVSGNAVAVDVAAPPPLNNDASAVVRTPDVLAPLFSLEDVHRVVSEALCEQREAMKAEWDAFRKDLLFDIRQAVSEASTRNVVGERADFEEPAAEMNESLVRRHLSKAFRKY